MEWHRIGQVLSHMEWWLLPPPNRRCMFCSLWRVVYGRLHVTGEVLVGIVYNTYYTHGKYAFAMAMTADARSWEQGCTIAMRPKNVYNRGE